MPIKHGINKRKLIFFSSFQVLVPFNPFNLGNHKDNIGQIRLKNIGRECYKNIFENN